MSWGRIPTSGSQRLKEGRLTGLSGQLAGSPNVTSPAGGVRDAARPHTDCPFGRQQPEQHFLRIFMTDGE